MGNSNNSSGMMILLLGGGCVCCVCVVIAGLVGAYFLLPDFKKWVDGLFGIAEDSANKSPTGDGTGSSPDGGHTFDVLKYAAHKGATSSIKGGATPEPVQAYVPTLTDGVVVAAAKDFQDQCAEYHISPKSARSTYKSTKQSDGTWKWVMVQKSACGGKWARSHAAGLWVCPRDYTIIPPTDPKDTPWCTKPGQPIANRPASKLPSKARLGARYDSVDSFKRDGINGFYGPCQHTWYRTTYCGGKETDTVCNAECTGQGTRAAAIDYAP